MTGFGRASGSCGSLDWSWELRAVNGKGLDLRMRLPPGFEQLEQHLRKICQESLSRGNIQIALNLQYQRRQPVASVNTEALQNVLSALAIVDQSVDVKKSSAAEILALRGVMEVSDADPVPIETDALFDDLVDGFKTALAALNRHRAAEGEELRQILLDQISQIERLTQQVQADPSRTPEAINNRIQLQLSRLGDMAGKLNQDRLYQEVALLATRSDIQEELDRLDSHIRSAAELIEGGSPVGRKLEFLGQEFNRETNTLCAKSHSVTLTETGLELKMVIDQFREQILNVE